MVWWKEALRSAPGGVGGAVPSVRPDGTPTSCAAVGPPPPEPEEIPWQCRADADELLLSDCARSTDVYRTPVPMVHGNHMAVHHLSIRGTAFETGYVPTWNNKYSAVNSMIFIHYWEHKVGLILSVWTTFSSFQFLLPTRYIALLIVWIILSQPYKYQPFVRSTHHSMGSTKLCLHLSILPLTSCTVLPLNAHVPEIKLCSFLKNGIKP